jgi:hypothetical protein
MTSTGIAIGSAISQQQQQYIQLDLDLSPIPGQQAWVIVDLNGQIIKMSSGIGNSGTTSSDVVPSIVHDVPILYQMLMECATILTPQDGGLNRMTITFGGGSGSGDAYYNINHSHHVSTRAATINAPSSSTTATAMVTNTSTSTSLNNNSNNNNVRYVIGRDRTHIYMIQTSVGGGLL